uniref:FAD-binding domain-containing protein n=1 Tax=Salix viminalis TaxID=40686 RepID=A0A6N2MDL0_SALVM
MDACGEGKVEFQAKGANTHRAVHICIDERRDGDDGGCGDRRSRHCRVGNSSGSEKSRGTSFGIGEIARDTSHRGSVTNINTGDVQQVLFSEQGIRPVHRKALLEALAEELPTDTIRFSSKLAAIESHEQGGGASIAVVHLEDGTAIKSKVLIGCDGVNSVVARWLGLAEPVHSGRSAVRSLAVFPQGHRFKHEVQQFVDQAGKRAAFVPLNDREFYWFLTCKDEERDGDDGGVMSAGIAGLATAVALKRVGVRALVLERSQGIRATGAALTLFPNAWLALDALGVSHKLTRSYDPLFNGSVTNINTGDVQQVLFSEQGIRTVHRKTLLEALAEELPTDSIRFSSKLAAIESQEQGDGTAIKSKVLIGCDGVHSVVARWLGLAEPVHSGRSAVRSLAVFPQGHRFKHEVQQFVDHQDKRAGFVPLNDREFYWFLTCKEENMTGEPEQIQREVLEKYAENFPSIYLDVVRHADLSTITWAPLMYRHPWRIIFGNLNKGNITVAGDAMHPMTPDLGQGGGSSLEDAVVLGRHIGNSIIKNGGQFVEGDMAKAIDDYVKERRWRGALLVTGSYFSGWIQQGGAKRWVSIFLVFSLDLRIIIVETFLLCRLGRRTKSRPLIRVSNLDTQQWYYVIVKLSSSHFLPFRDDSTSMQWKNLPANFKARVAQRNQRHSTIVELQKQEQKVGGRVWKFCIS